MPQSPIQVLIVEDDPAVEFALQTRLQQLGAHVRTARNGIHALRELRTCLPNVVLLDCELPGMDGLNVARILRTGIQNAHTEIIAYSGRSDPEMRAEFSLYGIPVVLKVPGSWHDLVYVLKQRLGWPLDPVLPEDAIPPPQELAI